MKPCKKYTRDYRGIPYTRCVSHTKYLAHGNGKDETK